MATSPEFMEFIMEQIDGVGGIRYRKMFGEYMVYVNDKPVLLVCDDTVFVKMRDEIKKQMQTAETSSPYVGAKPHYILDIENRKLAHEVIRILEPITPFPKPKKKKGEKL